MALVHPTAPLHSDSQTIHTIQHINYTLPCSYAVHADLSELNLITFIPKQQYKKLSDE